MKIPTYLRQTAQPQQGAGTFLSAQLSPAAMSAPARAAAESANELARTAGQFADLSYKKAAIDAESRAIEAAANYATELEELSQRALLEPPATAERTFEQGVNLAARKSSVGMNKLARDEFSRRSQSVRAQSAINFKRANNQRYIEQAQANVTLTTDSAVDIGSNVSNTPIQRLESIAAARLEIDNSADRIGVDKAALAHLKLDEDLATNIVASAMTRDANPLRVAEAFAAGTLDDAVLRNISLSPAQRQEIANSAYDAASKLIEVRQKQRADQDKAGGEALKALNREVVNVDLNDPAAVDAARDTFARLLAAGYYETTAARDSVYKLLYPESEPFTFTPTADSVEEERRLEELESLNQLSYRELLASRDRVSPEFFGQMLQALEGDRSEAETDSINLFRDAFMYTEEADDGDTLKAPSRMAFRSSSRELRAWIRDNPKATYSEVGLEAERIVSGKRDKFIQTMQQNQRLALASMASTLGRFPLKIAGEGAASMAAILDYLAGELAEDQPIPRRQQLLQMLSIANEEYTFEVLLP